LIELKEGQKISFEAVVDLRTGETFAGTLHPLGRDPEKTDGLGGQGAPPRSGAFARLLARKAAPPLNRI
jgi:hypothetical protein